MIIFFILYINIYEHKCYYYTKRYILTKYSPLFNEINQLKTTQIKKDTYFLKMSSLKKVEFLYQYAQLI